MIFEFVVVQIAEWADKEHASLHGWSSLDQVDHISTSSS